MGGQGSGRKPGGQMSNRQAEALAWLRERKTKPEDRYCRCGPRRVEGGTYMGHKSCLVCGKLEEAR